MPPLPQLQDPARHRSARIGSHEMQLDPIAPQLSNPGVRHWPVTLQQPERHETESQTQPLERQRCWPLAQAGPLPQRQLPSDPQLFARTALHPKQLPPPVPHCAVEG